jgi:putative pyruvate formate lyase activating enzyme
MEKKSRRRFLRSMLTIPGLTFFPAFLLRGMSTQSKAMTTSNEPGYLKLHRNGELKARGEIIWNMMRRCTLCPRQCETNRLRGRRGDCKSNSTLEISSAYPHFGEENELVGTKGSGTVFFTNCSLLCVFCINYEISHLGQGRNYTIRELANMMLLLQRQGCHNLNLVTPTHYAPHILLALDNAAARGFRLPVVYNTCGWEKLEVLQMLDGVVDVYLADFKYADAAAANKYSPGASSYPEITQQALLEMQRQVGVAHADSSSGIMSRGLMIRHLVMPGNVAQSQKVMQWIASNLPKDTYVNIMSQYTPMFRAGEFPEIARRISLAEYQNAVNAARRAGLTNLRLQMQ